MTHIDPGERGAGREAEQVAHEELLAVAQEGCELDETRLLLRHTHEQLQAYLPHILGAAPAQQGPPSVSHLLMADWVFTCTLDCVTLSRLTCEHMLLASAVYAASGACSPAHRCCVHGLPSALRTALSDRIEKKQKQKLPSDTFPQTLCMHAQKAKSSHCCARTSVRAAVVAVVSALIKVTVTLTPAVPTCRDTTTV